MSSIETPAYVVDLAALRSNLEVLARVQREAECTILLALKGFAMWGVFPVVRQYLSGIAASGPHEARLGREEFGGLVHTYSPAYSEQDLREVIGLSDHVVFNSLSQWRRFREIARSEIAGGTAGPESRQVKFGLRVNPEHSEVEHAIYDPCAPRSRLGIRASELEGLDPAELGGVTGLHFHTLCELGADALERTLAVVERRFAALLPKLDWVNFGGGHHVTRADYDVERLIRIVRGFRQRYALDVYLEPGEAIALNTGVLVAEVLDIVDNDGLIAVVDTSATAHMPDVLEMPYRPIIVGAAEPRAKEHTYRLGGVTCLAGDFVGDYSFDQPLKVGDRLVFLDMAHYTMVKNTTFNGVRLPSIVTYEPSTEQFFVQRRFGYEDYKARLS